MNDPRHDPGTIDILTYAWVLGLALLGGFANFIGKHRRGEVRAFNVTELIGELVISAFAGIITFYLCAYAGLDMMLTAALVGMCGHMGSRSIIMIERKIKSYVDGKRIS